MVVSKCKAFCSVTAKPGQRRGRSSDSDREGVNTLAAAAAAAASAAESPEARRFLADDGGGGSGGGGREEDDNDDEADEKEEEDEEDEDDDDDEEEANAPSSMSSTDEDALAELEEDDRGKADAAEAIVAPALCADADSLDGFAGGGCDERRLVEADAPLPPDSSEADEADGRPTRDDEGSATAAGGRGACAAEFDAALGAALSGMSGHKIRHTPPDSSIASCRRRRSWRYKKKKQKRKTKTRANPIVHSSIMYFMEPDRVA